MKKWKLSILVLCSLILPAGCGKTAGAANTAEVLEVRDGSLLVSFISTPELFMSPVTGQCVVRTNPEIMKEEPAEASPHRLRRYYIIPFFCCGVPFGGLQRELSLELIAPVTRVDLIL